jgi:hypothetical protein
VARDTGLRSDQTVLLTGVKTRHHYPIALRRLTYRDPKSAKRFVFLTNNFLLPALTIAQLYQNRWSIEVFFKALKQNLKVKSFVGTSENALRIKIWTALIAILLLKWLHHLSKAKCSLLAALGQLLLDDEQQSVILQCCICVAHPGFPKVLNRLGDEASGEASLQAAGGDHGSRSCSLDCSRSKRRRKRFSSLMASRVCLKSR